MWDFLSAETFSKLELSKAFPTIGGRSWHIFNSLDAISLSSALLSLPASVAAGGAVIIENYTYLKCYHCVA